MLEKVGYPLRVFLVRLLAFDRPHLLEVDQNHVDMVFDDFENGYQYVS